MKGRDEYLPWPLQLRTLLINLVVILIVVLLLSLVGDVSFLVLDGPEQQRSDADRQRIPFRRRIIPSLRCSA